MEGRAGRGAAAWDGAIREIISGLVPRCKAQTESAHAARAPIPRSARLSPHALLTGDASIKILTYILGSGLRARISVLRRTIPRPLQPIRQGILGGGSE